MIATETNSQPNAGAWGLAGTLTTDVLPEIDSVCALPLLDQLRSVVARDPSAIALASLSANLTYGDLLRLSENAAHAVAGRVPPGAAVACILPRQPDSVACLLGCLIAGRPCMVIDPADPIERRLSLLRDAAPALLVTVEPAEADCPNLTLATALAASDRPWRPDHVWDPDAPFAIHFTSGSTGRPKGIVLSARSVLYRGVFGSRAMGVTAESRVIQPIMPYASAGLSTLLGALLVGARVVLVDVRGDGAGGTLKLIEREAVTVAAFGPATLGMLMGLRRARPAFRSLRVLRLGGNSVIWSDLKAWRDMLPAECTALHAYASTEALTMAQWEIPAGAAATESRIPAGILHLCHEYGLRDQTGQPVPTGEAGELVLRGRVVALGEWRDGGLVPGRMTSVPDRPGWREFRTGDVVRVGADGMVRVLGRADRQVKINGVLVQPAEIEAVLKGEPGVADAAVVARTTPSGTVLHGFVASAECSPEALITALRQRLAKSLPPAFRPPRLTVLPRLPMLPSGKIDMVDLARRADR